jgi:hypothetical protein
MNCSMVVDIHGSVTSKDVQGQRTDQMVPWIVLLVTGNAPSRTDDGCGQNAHGEQ